MSAINSTTGISSALTVKSVMRPASIPVLTLEMAPSNPATNAVKDTSYTNLVPHVTTSVQLATLRTLQPENVTTTRI